MVATEVRALAQRSSEAVTAIQALMTKSGTSISDGSQRVVSSGNALKEMIEIIDRVSDRVERFAASSKVQAVHLSEVNSAVADLERDTQQNAAMAEQSSAASELLRQEVALLTERTAMFTRSKGRGQKRGAVPTADLRLYG